MNCPWMSSNKSEGGMWGSGDGGPSVPFVPAPMAFVGMCVMFMMGMMLGKMIGTRRAMMHQMGGGPGMGMGPGMRMRMGGKPWMAGCCDGKSWGGKGHGMHRGMHAGMHGSMGEGMQQQGRHHPGWSVQQDVPQDTGQAQPETGAGQPEE